MSDRGNVKEALNTVLGKLLAEHDLVLIQRPPPVREKG